ncbi:MAG: transcriptional regulator [Symploca sp. SIO2C1]|nr:transcriptional regulator [Symploca sp. SIO2C1]
MLTFTELWEKLVSQDESVEIEAKSASEIGKSILETVSAFANEPERGGGYLILGVKSSEDDALNEYKIIGLSNPDKIQRDLATQCREVFNIPIRPQIEVSTEDGKTLIVVFIPEAKPSEKPVYLVRKGLPKGAFRRIGSTDQKFTDEDIDLFYALRSHHTYDETPIPETSLDDFEPNAIAEYRRARSTVNANAAELNYTDEELLYALAATTKHQQQTCPTLAGLMLFGKSMVLRRHFPMNRVDYIIVEGREWIPDPAHRYQSIEILEPLLLAIPKLVTLILNDIPKAFTLGENGIHRNEVPLIPRTVIREAIVNALMHRNYRIRQPVQIIRYSNRLEIRNPGHSLKPIDSLGEPGSITRNEKIAAVLHEIGMAETKGSGIRVMFDEMQKANLTVPLFESSQEKDSFIAKLLVHHLLGPADIEWLARFKHCSLSDDEARALIVLREVGEINNFIYRAINRVDPLTASQHLRRLRDAGLLEQQGKGSATFYTLHSDLLDDGLSSELAEQVTPYLESSSTDKQLSSELAEQVTPYLESSSTDKQLSVEFSSTDKESYLNQIPEHLHQTVDNLGKRANPQEVCSVIVALCQWRDFSSQELSTILNRDKVYLLNKYLNPLIKSGSLEYARSKNPTDPHQAYRTTRRKQHSL